MPFYYDSNVVVLISFVLFFAVLYRFGVHTMIFGALDARAERIKNELDEARRLREEAQATFAEFERKQKEVAAQAEDIVTHAREEAEAAAVKAREDLAGSIERRLRAADEQIAMAEQQAVRAVKNKAVEVAIAAAGRVIAERLGDDKADALIDDSIKTVGARLH
ncbi:MAG: ATP F0F1 synthase subunit B [Pseudomonadota bacterium]